MYVSLPTCTLQCTCIYKRKWATEWTTLDYNMYHYLHNSLPSSLVHTHTHTHTHTPPLLSAAQPVSVLCHQPRASLSPTHPLQGPRRQPAVRGIMHHTPTPPSLPASSSLVVDIAKRMIPSKEMKESFVLQYLLLGGFMILWSIIIEISNKTWHLSIFQFSAVYYCS